MKREVVFPKLSAKTDEGVLVSWEKKVGDQVTEGDVLYEVETDKTILEVESPYTGELLEIKIPKGSKVDVDEVLAIMEVE
jgi:Pyruvate/2-oxoglutarate dehydrogenase complex, dihydrolipoamide acyltransferase (E2) component, and related enzymes